MPSHEALESTGSMRGLLLFYTVNPPAFSSLFLRFFFAFSSLFLRFFLAFSSLFLGFPSGLKTVSWRHLPNTCADTSALFIPSQESSILSA